MPGRRPRATRISAGPWPGSRTRPGSGSGWSTRWPGRPCCCTGSAGRSRSLPGGPLVLVWDGLNTHPSRAMRELIAARDWLTVFRLPPYAPELNPVEPVWSVLKRSLANLVKQDIGQLTALVKTRLRRMQYQPGLLEGFLAKPRLDLTPLGNFHN